MKKYVTEPMPLRIIKFQKYLQQCAINVPTNGDSLGLLGIVLANADYKSVSNNHKWFAPNNPDTAPVLTTTSAEGASIRSAS